MAKLKRNYKDNIAVFFNEIGRISAILYKKMHKLDTGLRLYILLGISLTCIVIFMGINLYGDFNDLKFIINLRAKKLVTLILVGYSIAVSTLLFQTATGNRILTPAIMGFDALYVLIQTCLIFFFGSKFSASLNPQLMFAFETLIMTAVSGVLYWALFASNRNIHQLILTGVILGVLFHSISTLIQRLIDPNEFNFLQDRFFASFNNPDTDLLLISLCAVTAASFYGFRNLSEYDVMVLGRNQSINLGIDYNDKIKKILLTVAVLVSVSTALVGPVTFFGLLVVHLAYFFINGFRHKQLIIATSLIAFISLVSGQIILEQLFSFDTNLRVIVDFLGGMAFILLLINRKIT